MIGAAEHWLALWLLMFVLWFAVLEWVSARKMARLVRWEERLIAWQAEVQALADKVRDSAAANEAKAGVVLAQLDRRSKALQEAAALISYGAHQEAIEVLEACPGIDVSVNGQRRTAS
jgi:hypothetical protein